MIVLLGLMGGSLFFKSFYLTFGILSGGMIVIFDFKVMRMTIEKLFFQQRKLGFFILILNFFRFLILAGVIFLLIRFHMVNTVGFLVGISTLFMGIGLEALVMIFEERQAEEI